MKQCPECLTTYTDDSLRFCLADGQSLNSVPENDATLVMSRRGATPTDAVGATPDTWKSAGPSTAKAVVTIGLVFLVIVGAAGIAGALLYFNRESRKANTSAFQSSSPSLTPDTEKQKLQDQLANIQRQLDEQKGAEKNISPAPPNAPTPSEGQTGFVTARVNSPNDRFLALRDKPHAEFGNRLERIPHGATVTIENCGPLQQRLGGRVGRWCMVTYNGKTGYVFDAFLDRQ